MSIWAIGDLHLSFGTPDKKMDIFGDNWANHPEKIEKNWRSKISNEDLVLLPGDISWAKDLKDAMPDLEWIHSLPGTKVMIRGNHDYWWSSIKKVRDSLPASIHAIQHDTFVWNDYIIGGARLWDTPEYNFGTYIPYVKNPAGQNETEKDADNSEQIFVRELHRLSLSLEQLKASEKTRIVMTHYPPISAELHPSRVSALLEQHGVHTCVFGHLHGIRTTLPMFGKANDVRYILTAADFIDFDPVQIF